MPTRSGYIFLGYFTQEEGGLQLINADGCLSGSLTATRYLEETTLYAHWQESEGEDVDPGEENAYSITYKEVNGSATGTDFSGHFMTFAPTTGVTGTAALLPDAYRTGYTFGGWYLKARGTGRAVTELPAAQTDDVTVYAKWIANQYTITLVTNGGTYAEEYEPADQYQHGGDNVALPGAEQIVRENYTFLGWFDNAALLGDAITEVDATQVAAQTYYAGWEKLPAHQITLTLDGEDGTHYTITGVEGYGFSEEGTILVYDGQAYCFEVNAAPAYRIKSVKANGKVLAGEDGVYTVSSVTEDMTITVVTESLVSTDAETDAVATILLGDGTTGYFTTLEAAISYAANYGSGLEIKLQQDFEAVSIDALAGNVYTIDLNGHTITGDSELLIEDGAQVTLVDSVNRAENVGNTIDVENRGELTNGIWLSEVLNLGIVTNNGVVNSLIQQDSETYEKSQFINNGSIGTAALEDGYFVENVLSEAPAGLSGYHTIMNGNEYYVNFSDAVDIANASDSDVTIQILATVDNRNQTIALNNANGRSIMVDLGGYDISSGEITTAGEVSFTNVNGSAASVSEISAAVTNTGSLTVGSYVKISGTTVNEEEASLKTEPESTISGPTTNEGNLENGGNVTGVYTNDGNTVNNGTMNNVIQKSGDLTNNGNIDTAINLQGGSYTAAQGATPAEPDGAVAKSNTSPVTYYGTLADAAQDAGDEDVTGAAGQESPFVITILKDISTEELGSDPVVLDPASAVKINLNNHTIGDEKTESGIQIGSGAGEAGTSSVTVSNEPENGETPDPEKGQIHAPVQVKEEGTLAVGSGVTVDAVDNDGKLTLDEGSNIEKLDNSGETESDGTIGTLTQDDGTFQNGENGTVEELTQTGGSTENKGGTITELTQTGGSTENKGGTITKLTQTGGTTENTDGGSIGSLMQSGGDVSNDTDSTIEDATLKGGSYSGTTPEKVDGKETTEKTDPAEGKTAVIEPADGGSPIYFLTLQDALAYASGMEESPVTVKLLTDVTDETVDVTPAKSPASQVCLDLNGRNVTGGSIKLEEGLDLTITDRSSVEASKKGSITSPIENSGSLTVDTDITLSGDMKNNQGAMLSNDGGTITGKVTNNGDIVNSEGGQITGTVVQDGGTYTNGEGAYTAQITSNGGKTINLNTQTDPSGETRLGIGSVDLKKGSYQGDEPSTLTGGVAKIGDKQIYGDLESAVADANASNEDVTIELTQDVTLDSDDALTISNENGKDITIDLSGRNISGGSIQIGDEEGTSGGSETPGKVILADSSMPESGSPAAKGTIFSPISVEKDGSLQIEEGVNADGTVTVDGTLDNSGNITGPVTVNKDGSVTNEENGTISGALNNAGDTRNKGHITGAVTQTDGSLTNEEGGSITTVEQTGGSLTNESTQPGSIGSASVKGGTYEGTPAAEMDYDAARAVVITRNADGTEKTVYYNTIEDALAGMGSNDLLRLLDDVTSEDISSIELNQPGVTLDLNGHKVDVPVKVTKDADGATITDASENGNGAITNTVTNEGGLVVDEGVKVTEVVNNGSLRNDGILTKLTNKGGDVVNNGSVDTLVQDSGSMTNNQKITDMTFTGGSFEGADPTNASDLENAVAKIDNKRYVSLEDAIKDANQAADDVTITMLKDTTLPDMTAEGSEGIGNENGKQITLDLDGRTLSGGPIVVKGPGETSLSNSDTNGEGSFESDVKVEEGATLTIEADTELDGSLDNQGNTENKGTITDDVVNTGSLVNGEDGVISGRVDNQGSLDNAGNIDNNVVNSGNGTAKNSGNINGQLENKDSAKTDNTGSINQVKQSGGEVTNAEGGSIKEYRETGGNLKNQEGGSIESLVQTGGTTDSQGTIKDAEVSDLKDYTGKLPENGLEDAKFTVITKNADGSDKLSYYPTITEALTDAPENATVKLLDSVADEDLPEGSKGLTIDKTGLTLDLNGHDVHVPVTVTEDATDVTLADSSASGSQQPTEAGRITQTITNNGGLTIDQTLTADKVENGKTGNLDMKGTLGELVNEGKAVNSGTIGSVNNKGTTVNIGTITENVTNIGSLTNGEDGVINGEVDNRGSLDNAGSIGQVKLSDGEVVNEEGASIDQVNQTGGTFKNEEGASINRLKQTGGTTDNEGAIQDAEVSDLQNYTGKLPENGLADAAISLTYPNEQGEQITAYYKTLSDALRDAETKNPAEVLLLTDSATVTEELTVPKDVVLTVSEGKKLTIGEGGCLTIQGAIEVEKDAALDNDGTIKGMCSITEPSIMPARLKATS